jgi:hypothetical protein
MDEQEVEKETNRLKLAVGGPDDAPFDDGYQLTPTEARQLSSFLSHEYIDKDRYPFVARLASALMRKYCKD